MTKCQCCKRRLARIDINLNVCYTCTERCTWRTCQVALALAGGR